MLFRSLPEDHLSTIEDQRLRAGGDVNLFVAYPDTFTLVTMTNGEGDGNEGDAADVHPDSTIDMVLYWLREQPAAKGSIKVGVDVLSDVKDFDYAL